MDWENVNRGIISLLLLRYVDITLCYVVYSEFLPDFGCSFQKLQRKICCISGVKKLVKNQNKNAIGLRCLYSESCFYFLYSSKIYNKCYNRLHFLINIQLYNTTWTIP